MPWSSCRIALGGGDLRAVLGATLSTPVPCEGVEIGASGKALAFVNNLGMAGERQTGARAVLKAAAWTYVAGALTALLTFLYYVFLIFGRRD